MVSHYREPLAHMKLTSPFLYRSFFHLELSPVKKVEEETSHVRSTCHTHRQQTTLYIYTCMSIYLVTSGCFILSLYTRGYQILNSFESKNLYIPHTNSKLHKHTSLLRFFILSLSMLGAKQNKNWYIDTMSRFSYRQYSLSTKRWGFYCHLV